MNVNVRRKVKVINKWFSINEEDLVFNKINLIIRIKLRNQFLPNQIALKIIKNTYLKIIYL
jgi:hypothetical protein